MKLCWLTFTFLAANASYSAEKPPTLPASEVANFHYFEVYPKESLNLTFSGAVCSDHEIQIKSFESSAEYPSVDSGKPKNVRIINLYANALTSCPKSPRGQLTTAHLIAPVSERMTHVYVTTTGGVRLKE